uniref:Agenet domain-containing protein n=1 Tax=Ananas comosus var. bracteatus TaxID=296719 RepID=A0A6V7PM69_ANACO|nr:unnamed protein product [Ananas comosus var. bracteatus]
MEKKKKKKKKKPKPQERGPSGFPTGAAVEVQSDDEGFRSAWYEAAVLSHNRRRGRYRVAYTTLLDDSDEHHGPSLPLTELVHAAHLGPRPPPPRRSANDYAILKDALSLPPPPRLRAHPKVADILNRPIKYYEELRIICGDDQATGYFNQATGYFKSSLFDEFGENNNETFPLEYQKNDNEREDEVEEIDGRFAQAEGARQAPNNKASSLPSRARSSAKRAREDPYLVDLVSCVGEVANALKRSAAVTEKVTTHWMEELFTKIKEISGYKSEIYKAVFEYLCQSEMQARVFMTKDLDMQHSWFKRSVTTHFSDLGGFL